LISSVNVNISNATASSTEDKKAHITFILEVRINSAFLRTQKIAQLEGVLRSADEIQNPPFTSPVYEMNFFG
jgi:hypothetical protein